ncbi:MAG: hypothetical protein QN141_03425 [Armatimonadota bacterium]|nr:hypothetical protein [Armatimonadota bacterium]MDR7451394.1 hypothetical protein [Armatimonadota bacterium]MDR7466456.1 hypothetical protein [Armatimonadota bacterium]MDR7493178.1 hypothetical protein [Armatimonadota bacterium]MDR7499469.1 hypothetical protein [Armatimonadota bacterium]
MQRYARAIAAWAASLALVAAVPAGASAQSPEEKATRIKAALEREGLAVVEVTFLPADREGPPHWFALTRAAYLRPNWPDVAQHALRAWLAVNGVVGGDDPQTIIFSSQLWTKYVVQLGQQNEKISEFARALRAARSDADRDRAALIVLKRFRVRIYDVEAQRFLDVKDFVNKNFID